MSISSYDIDSTQNNSVFNGIYWKLTDNVAIQLTLSSLFNWHQNNNTAIVGKHLTNNQ